MFLRYLRTGLPILFNFLSFSPQKDEQLTSNSPVILTDSNCSLVSILRSPLELKAIDFTSSKLGSTKRSDRSIVFLRRVDVTPREQVNYKTFVFTVCNKLYGLIFITNCKFYNLFLEEMWTMRTSHKWFIYICVSCISHCYFCFMLHTPANVKWQTIES